MLRALQSCLIILSSIILLSTSSYALTSMEFLLAQEDIIVELCEDFEARREVTNENSPFMHFSRYECGLTLFYALRKVTRLILTIEKDTDDYRFLSELLVAYYIEKYDTYNFIAIHLDFEEYLEEKSSE